MSPYLDQPLAATRREFLAAGVALSVAGAGLFHTRSAWAQKGAEIILFKYRAPQAALDAARIDLPRQLLTACPHGQA